MGAISIPIFYCFLQFSNYKLTITFLTNFIFLHGMSLSELIISSLYFFLPAFVANMAPEFFKWVPFNQPIWGRKLGKNKTWRGVIVAVVFGIVVFWLQKWLFQFTFFKSISLINYVDFSLGYGFLLGLGAILGDAVESYFKRKNKIGSGESWMPYDQIDFAIGALVLGWLMYVPKAEVATIILVFSFILHLIVSRIGFWLGIKKSKF